jgi:hypothetical protein
VNRSVAPTNKGSACSCGCEVKDFKELEGRNFAYYMYWIKKMRCGGKDCKEFEDITAKTKASIYYCGMASLNEGPKCLNGVYCTTCWTKELGGAGRRDRKKPRKLDV